MKQEVKLQLDKLFDEQYISVEPYLKFNSLLFHEMEEMIREGIKCILFKNPVALITLTNHILERLLKVALIHDAVGLKEIDASHYNETFREPHEKFSKMDLEHTINICCTNKLITKEQKKHLKQNIQIQIRNGFSHSDPNKILSKAPESSTFYLVDQTSLTSVPLELNTKIIPYIAARQMYNLALETYQEYFAYVYELLKSIEVQIIEKHRK